MSLLQAITQLCYNYNIDSKSILKTLQSQLVSVEAKGQPCSVEGCKVKRCTKPKILNGKIVCSTHFKILDAKQTKLGAPKCMHIHTHGPKSGQTCTSKSVENGYCNRHQKQCRTNFTNPLNFDLLDSFVIEHKKLRAFVLQSQAIGYIDKRFGFVFSSEDLKSFRLIGVLSQNKYVPLKDCEPSIVLRFEKKIFF